MKTPPNHVEVEGTERKARAGTKRTAAADPKEELTVSIRVRRRLDAPELPDLADLAATPRGEKTYLSREDFATHFGAAPEDLAAITSFADSNDLTVLECNSARRTVVLKGTVAQMGKAFGVDLGVYAAQQETYRGREGAVHVPKHLDAIIEGVFGLDNRRMARPHVRKRGAKATLGQGTVPLTPPQVVQLYGFPTSPNAAGQTIAILEFGGGFKLSDVQLFYKSVNAPVPSIAVVSVDGQLNTPGSDDYTVETLLDIDVSGSAAPGAKLAVYFAPWTEQGWVDAITTIIHDTAHKPSVLTISYGWPENEGTGGLTWSLAAIKAVNATLQEAAAMGVTVLVSAGDSGSDCGVGDKKAHVLYPGSDPYVTSCGGTSLSAVSGLTFKEDVWNDGQGNGITGGGISDVFCAPHFPLPAWQMTANLPGSVNDGHKGRGIPDIAGNADENSGYSLYLNGADIGPVGGTSATAPLYAALTALLNASLGEPVGYLNPNLYALPYAYVFRDISDGVSNASGGAPGYTSGPGWDGCTGLGGVNGTALLTALGGVGLPVAIETFNGTLMMVWKGMERDDRIWFSTFNGSTWSAQQQVPGIGSSTGVALAVYENKLFMAWKGILSDQGIYWTTYDGSTWAPQQIVPGVGTSTGPSIAVLGGNLIMAWKGEENDQRIFFNQFNGTTWTAQQFVPNVATSAAPALANLGNTIYMSWKGMNGDPGLYWSKFNGTAFAPQTRIPGVGSSEGPSLAVYKNTLYALWKGEFGDQRLWYSTLSGNTWQAQKNLAGVGSSVGAGLAVFNNALYACWKGELGDQSIYFSQFNGAIWANQKQIPGVGTSPDLARNSRVLVNVRN